ncbi:hypothetical protein [Corynebacterium uropygiale]|nr:hypothetical protein [Corynebacterium uropygiale]
MNPVQKFFQDIFLSMSDALGAHIHNGSSALANLALAMGWI